LKKGGKSLILAAKNPCVKSSPGEINLSFTVEVLY